jgi:hypothetical protein
MNFKAIANNFSSNLRSLFTTKLAADHDARRRWQQELHQTVFAMAAKIEELEDCIDDLNRQMEEFTETPPEIDYCELASEVDAGEVAEEIANHLDLTDVCEYIEVDEDAIVKSIVDRIQITLSN